MSRKVKKFLSVIALFAAILGIIFALVKCSQVEKTDIHPVFSLGTLNEDGNYEKSTTSIYTKDPFECRGLTITPDFESHLQYRVFFYGTEGQFVGATDTQTGSGAIPMSDIAVTARLVITPLDDDNKNIELKLWDVPKYSLSVKISVNADQTYEIPNLYELAKAKKYTGETALTGLTSQQIVEYSYFENATLSNSSKAGEYLKLAESDKFTVLILDCTNVKSYILTPTEWNTNDVYCTFWTYDEKFIETGSYNEGLFGGSDSHIINVREGACYAVFHLVEYEDISLCVYEYR